MHGDRDLGLAINCHIPETFGRVGPLSLPTFVIPRSTATRNLGQRPT